MKNLLWIDGVQKEHAPRSIGGKYCRFFIFPMTLRIPVEYYENKMFMDAIFDGISKISSKLLEDILYLKENLENLVDVPCYGVASINSKRRNIKGVTRKIVNNNVGFWSRTNLIFRDNPDNLLEKLKEEYDRSYEFNQGCSGIVEDWEYLEPWENDHKYNVISVLLK